MTASQDTRRHRTRTVGLALAAVALAMPGCGNETTSGESSRPEPTKLTVSVVPIHEVAPLYLGIKKGFFQEQNLELDVQTGQGGAAIVPQVLNQDVQIGFSNTPTLFAAAARGVPIQIVAPVGGSPREDERDLGAVMVTEDSPVRGYAGLAGKTVAVNALENVADVTLKAALDEHGVDHTQVKYLEVPFADMLAALDAGRVDAAFLAPPFETIARRSGGFRSIGFPFVDVRPEFVFTGYFASRQWAADHQDVLDRFLAALRKSMLYAAEHEQETRQTIGDYTELPNELLTAIPIGNRRPDCQELEVSSRILGALMVEYGALEREPVLTELIRPGFCEG